jgi:hypothetical protein
MVRLPGVISTGVRPTLRPALAAATACALSVPAAAHAQRWRDDTGATIGTTAEWTNKVELADVDGDGWLDILFANGRGYSSPGTLEASRVFRNRNAWGGAGPYFEEITSQVFGTDTGHTRAIKVRDIDGDGDDDVFVGNTWGTPSRLYRRDAGAWTDVTDTALPGAAVPRVGDADFGDVDGDGDLDLALSDWGTNLDAGGVTRLYLNDGAGIFTEATATYMPDLAVPWSWELDFADIDDDFDLDLLIASKLGAGSFVFRNDGTGHFTDDSAASLPQQTNNYEIECMDIDGDGDLDLATINDGTGGRNRLFRNDGGHFVDVTATQLAGTANPATDDNVIAFFDADSDGDADMVVGSLGGPDRLLLNDGAGTFTLAPGAVPGNTAGTLGIAIGDLDGDHRPDLVDGQGESAFPDFVYRATDQIAADTVAPHLGPVAQLTAADRTVRARVHDAHTPSGPLDLTAVVLRYHGQAEGEAPMTWYGEHLWRADLPSAGAYTYQVCATDGAGNQACSAELSTSGGADDGGTGSDAGPGGGGGSGGCCGAAPGGSTGSLGLAAAVLAVLRSARRRARVRPLTRT